MDPKPESREAEMPSNPGTAIAEQHVGASTPPEQEFKPGLHFWLAFAPIAVLAMMASLDGTSVSVALPVSGPFLKDFDCIDLPR